MKLEDQNKMLGHPVGLFILFFTEMWERFSYYGMRALLVLYLIGETGKGSFSGLGWSSQDASNLYGNYTMWVYFMPIIGGWLADKFVGYQKAIIVGAFLMTLGHLSLAFEPMPTFYMGLILLIIGNGFFKPNISSMVGQLYPKGSTKKDAGYTIFYQGINVGAFLGSLLCGYLGEKLGWHYGFGLAGIFMFIGMIQFWLSKKIFGNIGLNPKRAIEKQKEPKAPLTKAESQRLIVVCVLSFFSIVFWFAFEQAGSSMNIFASKHADRELVNSTSVVIFKIVGAVLQALPIIILVYLFMGIFKRIGKEYFKALSFMALSILALSSIVIYIIYDQFTEPKTEVPATWFQGLNALFIFTLAPLFSIIWQKLAKTKYNPNGPQKFSIGLLLLGLGFVPMVYGSASIVADSPEKASMIFLVLAYLLHTMGELSLSPVGLSYVNKLSPTKLLGLMFGVWFLASGLGNKFAGMFSGYMESIAQETSLAQFFSYLVMGPIVAGVVLFLLSFPLKKLMHGVK